MTTKISQNNISNSAIVESKIAPSAVSETKILNGAVTTNKLVDDAVTTTKVADNTITSAKLVDNSVTDEKLSSSLAANIAQGSAPKISTISYPNEDLAVGPDGGDTVILTGSGFQNGCQVYINTTVAPTVTFTNSTSVSFTTPALSVGASYLLYIINPDGSTGIAVPGLQVSGTPTWTTSAGALTEVTEDAYAGVTLNAVSDSNVTYSIYSGALPSGLSLNANTGAITGTVSTAVANLTSNTTYNFTVDASDAELQNTLRTFSITYVPTFPTWYSPNAGALTAGAVDVQYTVSLNAISNSNVVYTIPSGNLIANVDISGNVLTGTPPEANTYYFTIRATDEEGHYTDREFSLNVAVAADTYFKNTSLLLQGTTTYASDASSNNFDLTPAGNPYSTAFSPYNSTFSNYFDGSGDYLTVPNGAGFAFGTGDFTIECWVYWSYTQYNAIISTSTTAQNSGSWILGYSNTANSLGFCYDVPGFNFIEANFSSYQGKWTHVAVTRSGTDLRLYFNGTSVANTTNSTDFSYSSNSVKIGQRWSDQNSYTTTGYLSNLRVVKGTAVYTGASFTPPTAPLTAISGTSLLTSQSNRFIDTGASATVTVGGDTKISGYIPFADTDTTTGSGFFDGTGDYLSIPNDTDLNLGTGDFTIEAWVYLNSFTNASGAGRHSIIGKWNTGGNGYAYGIRLTSSVLEFAYGQSPGSFSWSTTFAINRWYHVAVTRSGTTVKGFVNGAVVGTETLGNDLSSSAIVTIGTLYDAVDGGPTHILNGHLSNLRIIKGTALYTSAFTPPTSALTAETGTSLLTLQSRTGSQNYGILDLTKKNTIVSYNSATQGTFSPFSLPPGYWSNYFDGNGDYLSIGSNAAFDLGSGNFTLEMWVSPTVLNANRDMRFFQIGGDSNDYFLVQYNTNAQTMYFGMGTGGGANQIISTSFALPVGVFTHLAFVREGTGTNQVKFYANGSLVASGTYAGTMASGGTVYIGGISWASSTTYHHEGFISNVRLVKGTAVYTGEFTPSTTPLTAVSGTSLLTCQDNRFVDNSTNGFGITVSQAGLTTQAIGPFVNSQEYSPSTNGGSITFGSDGYLKSTVNSTVVFGTQDFTVEAWVYPYSFPLNTYVIDTRVSESGQWAFSFNWNGTGNYTQLAWFNGSTSVQTSTSTPINQWNHVAYTRTGTSGSLYLNGVRVGTLTDSANYTNSQTFTIGARHSNAYFFDGHMSDINIVVGEALYTGSTYTMPTAPKSVTSKTSFLATGTNGGVIDSTKHNSFKTAGSTRISTAVKKFNGSIAFGSSNYLGMPVGKHYEMVFGTGDVTIEAWVYFNSLSGYPTIVDLRPSSGFGSESFVLWSESSTLSFYAGAYSGGSPLLYGGSLSTGQWYHVAVTRSSGTNRLFLNGVVQATNTNAWNHTYSSSAGLTVGATTLGASNTIDGYIEDLRITRGVARYTANFDPPTSAFINK